jgi:hypothetical protein
MPGTVTGYAVDQLKQLVAEFDNELQEHNALLLARAAKVVGWARALLPTLEGATLTQEKAVPPVQPNPKAGKKKHARSYEGRPDGARYRARLGCIKLDPVTGEELERYDTVNAAAKANGTYSSRVSIACSGRKLGTVAGFRWRYTDEERAAAAERVLQALVDAKQVRGTRP